MKAMIIIETRSNGFTSFYELRDSFYKSSPAHEKEYNSRLTKRMWFNTKAEAVKALADAKDLLRDTDDFGTKLGPCEFDYKRGLFITWDAATATLFDENDSQFEDYDEWYGENEEEED